MNVMGIKESATGKAIKILVEATLQAQGHGGKQLRIIIGKEGHQKVRNKFTALQGSRVLPKYYNERLAEEIRKKAST